MDLTTNSNVVANALKYVNGKAEKLVIANTVQTEEEEEEEYQTTVTTETE